MWSITLIAVLFVFTDVLCTTFDLTHPVDENSIHWVGVQPFVFTKKSIMNSSDEEWLAVNEYCAGEHVGTHFDAPYHFSRHGWFVGDVPLDHLVVPGVLIDVSSEVHHDGDFQLDERHIDAFETAHGPLSSHGARIAVLVKFGWAQFYNNRTAYFGTSSNDTTKLHFPGISGGAARKIVSAGNVVGVGLDTTSVDSGQSSDLYVTHRVLAAANIYNLENVDLTSPDLPATGFTLYVMPMKIAKGTGAPCRIFAITT